MLIMGTVHLSVISSLTRQYCGCQNIVVVVVVVVVFVLVLATIVLPFTQNSAPKSIVKLCPSFFSICAIL